MTWRQALLNLVLELGRNSGARGRRAASQPNSGKQMCLRLNKCIAAGRCASSLNGRPRVVEVKVNNAREALFRAAMELTAERGLYGFSLQDVAARTGTSRALIIHHFSSKEAFLDALVALLLDSEAEPVRFESAVEELALHVSNGLVEGLGDPVATRARIAVLCSAGPESEYHDQAQRWWRSRLRTH